MDISSIRFETLTISYPPGFPLIDRLTEVCLEPFLLSFDPYATPEPGEIGSFAVDLLPADLDL